MYIRQSPLCAVTAHILGRSLQAKRKKMKILLPLAMMILMFSCKIWEGKYCSNNGGCCGQCLEFLDNNKIQLIKYTDYSLPTILVGNYEKKNNGGIIYGLKPNNCKNKVESEIINNSEIKSESKVIIEISQIGETNVGIVESVRIQNKDGNLINQNHRLISNTQKFEYQFPIDNKEFPIRISAEIEYHWNEYLIIDTIGTQKIKFYLEKSYQSFGQSDTIKFKVKNEKIKFLDLNHKTKYLFGKELIKKK